MKYLILVLVTLSLILVGCPKKDATKDDQTKLEEPKEEATPEAKKEAPVSTPAAVAPAPAPVTTAAVPAPVAPTAPVKTEKPADKK